MKLAFVFPGQGSQAVGMMSGYEAHRAVRATFAEASDALGEDLWELVTGGPEEALDLTVNTQPLMLTAAIAVWRAWLDIGGPRPVVVAGHSLGEYSAMVAAGALSFRDAVLLVRFRAKAMQDAVPTGEGAMAAVLGADDEAVARACRDASKGNEVVEPVNFNAPGQLVIAGSRAAVERAMAAAKANGARRAVLLPVSAPFHSSLMKPAAEKLAMRLADVDFQRPSIPVLHNVDVQEHATPEAMRRVLAQHAASPVRWAQTIQAMKARGITHIAECGPGRVLTGLVERIDNSIATLPLSSGSMLEQTKTSLEQTA